MDKDILVILGQDNFTSTEDPGEVAFQVFIFIHIVSNVPDHLIHYHCSTLCLHIAG